MNKLTLDGFVSPHISYGFYGRQGGVSTGLYDSLNCSPQSCDDPAHIAENRARVLRDLDGQDLSTLKQIHSPVCRIVEGACVSGIEEGDALVTKTAGQVLGVLTADCGPVLFIGEDGRGAPVIGAAHAGWGGALKGVLERTISAMLDLGALKSSIHVAIGPCIGPASYEVGPEFKIPFIEEDPKAAEFFTSSHFDLPSYIRFRLRRAGVTNIHLASRDTYTMKEDYFSFRRSTHRQENDYGRQISAILIRKC